MVIFSVMPSSLACKPQGRWRLKLETDKPDSRLPSGVIENFNSTSLKIALGGQAVAVPLRADKIPTSG